MIAKFYLLLALLFTLSCAEVQRKPDQVLDTAADSLKCKLWNEGKSEHQVSVPTSKAYWGIRLNDLKVRLLFNYDTQKDLLKIKVQEGYPMLSDEYTLSFSATGTSESFNFLNIGPNSLYIQCPKQN